MIGLFCFVLAVLASPIKSKIRFEAENATLRHQLVVLRRKLKGRARLTNNDRWLWRREIGPHGFAVEVGAVQRIPGRMHLVSGERIPRRVALGDHRAIELRRSNVESSRRSEL